MAQRLKVQVGPLASLSGLRIWCCCEGWCRSQSQLGCGIAVAVVWSRRYSSTSAPSLGTSICRTCGHKNQKQNKQKQNSQSNGGLCWQKHRDEGLTSLYVIWLWLTTTKPKPWTPCWLDCISGTFQEPLSSHLASPVLGPWPACVAATSAAGVSSVWALVILRRAQPTVSLT